MAFGAYFNAGQVCCTTERVLVDRRVHNDFLDLLIQEAKNVRVGDPFHPEVKMGPMNNVSVLEKTEGHLADALIPWRNLLLVGFVHKVTSRVKI